MIKAFVRTNKRLAHLCERRWPQFFGEDNCTQELLSRIAKDLAHLKPARVVECGGIDRPLLEKCAAFRYIGLDIEERKECYSVYDEFYVQSVEEPFGTRGDMIISTTLLEHVKDNRAAIAQMYSSLSEDGTTHHYIPSKNHPYSLLLRALGHRAQRALIRVLRPEALQVAGYPAFFNYCSPVTMKRLFESCGFVDVDVKPFYRANDYFDFFFPAYVLITALENASRALGWSTWCSGFVISAKKAPRATAAAASPAAAPTD